MLKKWCWSWTHPCFLVKSVFLLKHYKSYIFYILCPLIVFIASGTFQRKQCVLPHGFAARREWVTSEFQRMEKQKCEQMQPEEGEDECRSHSVHGRENRWNHGAIGCIGKLTTTSCGHYWTMSHFITLAKKQDWASCWPVGDTACRIFTDPNHLNYNSVKDFHCLFFVGFFFLWMSKLVWTLFCIPMIRIAWIFIKFCCLSVQVSTSWLVSVQWSCLLVSLDAMVLFKSPSVCWELWVTITLNRALWRLLVALNKYLIARCLYLTLNIAT